MMKRTLQWRKILNTLAIGLALLLLGMIFGGVLQYGRDKKSMNLTVTTDEKKADFKNTTGGAILETGTENGMKIIKTKLTSSEYESYGVSSSAETAYTLTATVTPEDTADKAVDWSVGFVDPTSTWAVGKRATDYVTITPETDGGLTATASCTGAFAAQIEIRVTLRSNVAATANCLVDYVKKVNKVTLGLGEDSPDTEHRGHSLRIGTSTHLTVTFELGEGTVKGIPGIQGSLEVTLANTFSSAIRRQASFVESNSFSNPAKVTITGAQTTMDDANGNPAMKVTVSSTQVLSFLTMEAATSFTQEQRIRYNNAFVTAPAACGEDPHANAALPYTYTYHYENVSSGTAKTYVYFWQNDLSLQGVALDVNKPSMWF